MEKNEIWVKHKTNGESVKFRLRDFGEEMYNGWSMFSKQSVFTLERYSRDDNGNWVRDPENMLITLYDLLNDFILIGNAFD